MLELLVETLGEFLIQFLGEFLAELGLHSFAEPFQRQPNPWLAALGYSLFGALFGSLSFLVFPINLIPESWRLLNLIVTPVLLGSIMAAMGFWRRKLNQPVLRIDKFVYGYLFALAFALVRFLFPN